MFYKAYEQWITYDSHATPFYFMKPLQLFWMSINDKDYATTNAFQVLTNKSRLINLHRLNPKQAVNILTCLV